MLTQIEVGIKGVYVVTAFRPRTCFRTSPRFQIQKSDTSKPEWVKLKLQPDSKGYAVKVLRKTSLCEEEQLGGSAEEETT